MPEFKRVCEGAAPPPEKCAQLGALMDASQASCRSPSSLPPCLWSLHGCAADACAP